MVVCVHVLSIALAVYASPAPTAYTLKVHTMQGVLLPVPVSAPENKSELKKAKPKINSKAKVVVTADTSPKIKKEPPAVVKVEVAKVEVEKMNPIVDTTEVDNMIDNDSIEQIEMASEQTDSMETESSLVAPAVSIITEADAIYNPAPGYPQLSRRLGESGIVLLDVLILPNGRVGEVTVHTSSGFPRLDKAAIRAIKKWRYRPTQNSGEAVAYWYIQPMCFILIRIA